MKATSLDDLQVGEWRPSGFVVGLHEHGDDAVLCWDGVLQAHTMWQPTSCRAVTPSILQVPVSVVHNQCCACTLTAHTHTSSCFWTPFTSSSFLVFPESMSERAGQGIQEGPGRCKTSDQSGQSRVLLHRH